MTRRREFITQLGIAASGVVFGAEELRATTHTSSAGWDTSWIDHLAKAQYRVVFNANVIDDGGVMDYANAFFNDFHEVHGTTDAQTRPVIVFRRLGTPMALGDSLWDRYGIGEDAKINDPATRAPAKRNVFWRAQPGASEQSVATKLESLHARGLISLVCSVALRNVARGAAKRVEGDPERVFEDMKANLVPGAILVPSGIYALIRAQNAGCAFMLGT